jgi:hypothetical protein
MAIADLQVGALIQSQLANRQSPIFNRIRPSA